ncbi:MAG TPA: ATP-binding protein [Longimicrobium sp.]|nr:ATP-binding protein [Longimicrobium sp.]
MNPLAPSIPGPGGSLARAARLLAAAAERPEAASPAPPHRRRRVRIPVTQRCGCADCGLALDAAEALAAARGADDALRTTAARLVPAVADWCVVQALDPDGAVLGAEAAGLDAEREAAVRGLLDRERGPRDVAPRRQAGAGSDGGGPRPWTPPGLPSGHAVLVPLELDGELLGVAALGWARAAGARPDRLALAARVARLAALALRAARALAASRRAARARQEVLAVVAHDLRNPLGAVAMYAELLRGAEGGEQARRCVDGIARSADDMGRLVQDLLDASALDAGGLRVEPAAADPAALLGDAAEAFGAAADAAGLRLRREVSPGLPAVLADPARVQQVLGNLLGNAVRLTPAGGQVVLRAASAPDGVAFSVADTGPGIAPEHIARVFDPFWQARGGRGAGTGLGLSIAARLVQAHGGRIWVESQPGSGSTFSFTLPAVPGDAPTRGLARGGHAGGSLPAPGREPLPTPQSAAGLRRRPRRRATLQGASRAAPARGTAAPSPIDPEGTMSMFPTRRTGAALTEPGRLQNRLRQFFDEPFTFPFFGEAGWVPAIDVAESNGDLVVTAELPGMKKENVELELSDGILTLRGEKSEESERTEQEMYVTERSYGSFRRSVALPCAVDETRVAAEFRDGVLRVTLPKTGEPNGKKIEIAG